MAHFAIVVTDPIKHHARQIKLNVDHNVKVQVRPGMSVGEQARLRVAVENQVRAVIGSAREVGDLHTLGVSECPDGMPNCRNCGDPAHEEACRAAGHCPLCGTAHGIAPDAHLADGGMELVAVDPQAAGDVWDKTTRTFVKR